MKIRAVREVCMKHPGMMNDFLRASRVENEHLVLTRADVDRINAKYFGKGVGTILHNILEPIVAVPDKLFGLSLRNCGGCAERELKINSALSKK